MNNVEVLDDMLYYLFNSNYNYEDYTMIHSYLVNGKVRVFLGITNEYLGITYPIGCDLNKNEYFQFPINPDGTINEEKMIEELKNDDSSIGFSLEEYKKAVKAKAVANFLRILLKNDIFVLGSNNLTRHIINSLAELNDNSIQEAKAMITEKFQMQDGARK